MEMLLTHTVALVLGFACGVVFARNVRNGLADVHDKLDHIIDHL